MSSDGSTGWQHLVQSKLGMSDSTRIHASGAQVEDLAVCRFPSEVCGGNSVPGYSPGLVDGCFHAQVVFFLVHESMVKFAIFIGTAAILD